MSSKPEALIGCIRRGPERRWAARPQTASRGVGNAPHRRRSWRRGAKTGAATETSAVLGSWTTFGLSPSSSPSLLIILCIYFVDFEPVETIRELPAFEQQQYRADLTVGHSNRPPSRACIRSPSSLPVSTLSFLAVAVALVGLCSLPGDDQNLTTNASVWPASL